VSGEASCRQVEETKRRSVLLVVGLIAGVMLIALGIMFIRAGSIVHLSRYTDDWGSGSDEVRYILDPPYYDAIVAGILMTVSGSIAVGVSLTLMIVLRVIESEPGLN
jgi:uncharacterized membrane protein YphA (DoxX/SURF4 family)